MSKAFIKLLLLFLFIISISAHALTIKEVNQAIKKKGARWKAENNWIWNSSLSDKKQMMGTDPQEVKAFNFLAESDEKSGLPSRLDWRSVDGFNYMSPVTNQGKCGSCVAFAAIATLEGQVNITNKWPDLDMNFSEQHIWACGGWGCRTGWQTGSAASFLQSRGVPDEACFPYISGAAGEDLACNETCSDSSSRLTKIKNYTYVGGWFSNTQEIMKGLQHGPLMGRMTVYEDFIGYKGGIYEHVTGGQLGGHAITIIGYDNNEKYWIAKNSWGTEWGEEGYFRIKMDDDSGVGSGYRLFLDPFGGTAKVVAPGFRETISDVYTVVLESSYENTSSMQLEISQNGFSQLLEATRRSNNRYTVKLDTTSFEDGIYLAQAIAITDNEGVMTRRGSQFQRIFILNGSPTIQVAMNSPNNGDVLKKRVYIDFSIEAAPIPLEKLVLMIKDQSGKITKVVNNYAASKVLVGWRTYMFPNGTYEIWGEGHIGPHHSETKHITVTVNN